MNNRQFFVMVAIGILLVAVATGAVVGYQHSRHHGVDHQVEQIVSSAGVSGK
jgi:hypothetical protein